MIGTATRDVLVVGAGPSGAACAYWLASAGWDVLLLEKKHFPREKTCGDGLTPRAVRQLEDMGLGAALSAGHRFRGLRSVASRRSMELPWPAHPEFPPYGYVVERSVLDLLVAERAAAAGATLWQGAEALEPLAGGGAVVRRGAKTTEVRSRYVVVADGSGSRFGRALGASRRRDWPLGMAIRGYYRSERAGEPWIEGHLDLRDSRGRTLPGYGWIFPMGDGRVNVGVGLLSTTPGWKDVNTSHLLEAFVEAAPASWGLSPATRCGRPTGGKLPMGLAVGPRTGERHLLVGDAAGSINPFNGEGIAYAYETGRSAAFAVGSALAGGGPAALAEHERRLQAAYGDYYATARAFVALIGRPRLLATLVGLGMRDAALMGWVLRIMANLMRSEGAGAAEAAYRVAAIAAKTSSAASAVRSTSASLWERLGNSAS